MSVTLFSFCQNKHALVIAIGDYPLVAERQRNWTDLSSANDHELVMEMLKFQKFKESNIKSLLDKDATMENIDIAFVDLIKKVEEGDIVYFHFSGHGQQIADVDGSKFKKTKNISNDEKDGYDEALVTYSAPLDFEEGYEFEHHLVDDQMNYYFTEIRKKIKGSGQVIVVMDACHSGTGTRGGDDIVIRGTGVVCAPKNYSPSNGEAKDKSLSFDADFDYSNKVELGKLTAFFGCKAEQVNREYKDIKTSKQYGSLTFFMVKAMYELGEKASYMNLFSKVNEQMVIRFKNQQQPEIEGDDLNQMIFKGEFVKQDPFFNITKASGEIVVINGGSIQGLNVGDTIGLYSNTTSSIKEGLLQYRGVIEEVYPYTSVIKADSTYDGNGQDKVKYRAFILTHADPGFKIKVKLQIDNKNMQYELMKNLALEKNIEIVSSGQDYLIRDTLNKGTTNNLIIFMENDFNYSLREMRPKKMNSSADYDSIRVLLKDAMRTDLFRKMQMSDSTIRFEYSIIQCKQGKIPCIGESNEMLNGNYRFKEEQSFKVVVKNTGKKEMYLNMIDVDPMNRISWLKENNQGDNIRNFKIDKGDSSYFVLTVYPPFGLEQFKFIGSDRSIDFAPLESLGTSLATRGIGDESPLMDFVEQNVAGTRSVGASSDVGASVQTFTFEIIEND